MTGTIKRKRRPCRKLRVHPQKLPSSSPKKKPAFGFQTMGEYGKRGSVIPKETDQESSLGRGVLAWVCGWRAEGFETQVGGGDQASLSRR